MAWGLKQGGSGLAEITPFMLGGFKDEAQF